MSNSFKLFKKADASDVFNLTMDVGEELVKSKAPVARAASVEKLLNALNVIRNTSGAGLNLVSEEYADAAANVVGLIPHPVPQTFAMAWSVGKILGDLGLNSLFERLLSMTEQTGEELDLELIADIVLKAIEAKDKKAARHLLISASNSAKELRLRIASRAGGPKFDLLIALSDLEKKIKRAANDIEKQV